MLWQVMQLCFYASGSLSFVTNIEKNKHFYMKNNYENVNYKELDFRGKKVDNWSFRKIYK